MTALRGPVIGAWIGFGLAALVWVVDRAGEGWATAASAGRIIAIIGAVVVAATCYQVFSAMPPRTPRVIAAVVAGLVGGASTASGAVSAEDGRASAGGALSLVGLVALLLACVLLRLEARDRSAR